MIMFRILLVILISTLLVIIMILLGSLINPALSIILNYLMITTMLRVMVPKILHRSTEVNKVNLNLRFYETTKDMGNG